MARVGPGWLRRRWVSLVVVAAVYAAGSYAAFWLFRASSAGAVFFPPAGLTLAVLTVMERRRWPELLATIAVTETLVDLSQGIRFPAVALFALANTAEPMVGAWLLTRRRPAPLLPDRRRGLVDFVVAAVVAGPLVGAAIGTTAVVWGLGKGTWGSVFGPFWAGDALAVLTIGGLLLAWWLPTGHDTMPSAPLVAGICATVVVLSVLGYWSASTPLFWLPVPALAFVAVRYGSVALAYAVGLVAAVAANLMSALGYGPWARVASRPHFGLTTLQGFLAVSTLTAVVVAIAVSERDEAQQRSTGELLERQRLQVLFDNASCGDVTTDMRWTISRVNETFSKMTGHSSTSLVGAVQFSQLLPVGGRLYFETHFAPLLRMHGHAHEIAFDVVTASGERLPVLINAELQRDASGEPGGVRLAIFDVSERRAYEIQILHERRKVEEFARQLQQVQLLTASLTAASTIKDVADAFLRDGVNPVADQGVVALVDYRSRAMVRTFASFPLDESCIGFSYLPVAMPLPVTWVIEHGDVLHLPTLEIIAERFPAALATYQHTNTASCLSVPIIVHDAPIGALAFGFPDEGPVADDVLAYAMTAASLVGQAVDRAWLYEHEHDTAHTLQRALLPRIAPEHDHLSVIAHYRPALRNHDVGGDWYDVFALPDGDYAIVVGDVVGHDISAVTTMGHLQSAVRLYAIETPDPGALLKRLDRAVASIPGAFCTTMFYGRFHPPTGRLTYSCAGHPPPLLVTQNGIDWLNQARGTPLGVTPERTTAHADVPVGAHLLLYTDGLIESRGTAIDDGLARLAADATDLNTTDPAAWCEQILDRRSGHDQFDDIVLLCITRFDPTARKD